MAGIHRSSRGSIGLLPGDTIFRSELAAGQNVSVDLLIGAELVEDAANFD